MNALKNIVVVNLLALLLFTSCDDDDDDGSNLPDNGIDIETTDLIGQWRITRFIDDGDNETDDLDDFELDFQANNDLVITRGSESITASWSLSSDGRVLTLNINDDDADQIDPNDELEELDDDPWIFLSLNNNVLELLERDDDDDLDELTLTRI